MKLYITLLLTGTLSLLSVLPATAREEGGWTSGGGDPLRITFEEGQSSAAEILFKTEGQPFPSNVRPEVATWILTHRQELIEDIKASSLSWTIDPIEEQATCAVTDFSRAAPIRLSLLSCRSITSKEEAAKLLIHEATHHLGNTDETLADRVAVAVFAMWGNELNSDVPTCPTPRDRDNPMVQMISNLPGLWHRDIDLSESLGAERGGEGPKGYVAFSPDLRMLARFKNRPVGHCAFSGGSLKISNRRGDFEAPYIIADVDGRATLFALPNRRFGMQIIRGQDREKDLLFLTDLDTQEAVSAYSRGLREAPEQPASPRRPGPRPGHY